MSSFRVAALTLTVSAGLIAAGCGASSTLSPTGPSAGTALSSGILASSDGGEFAPEKKGGEHGDDEKERGPGKAPERSESPAQGQPDSRGVEVNGRITTLDLATRTVTVGDKKVSVPVTAVIRHGSRTFTFADLHVGDHIQVKGATNEAGVVVASELKVEQGGNRDGEDEDDDVVVDEPEARGVVSALTGTCPALTFNILTTKVTTSAATVFNGLTCATLANAAVVEVQGTTQADGSVVATRISTDTTVRGAVSVLAGACPALTFTVATLHVATTVTTLFPEIACAAIANGTMLEVEGTLQADGSIVASRVSHED